MNDAITLEREIANFLHRFLTDTLGVPNNIAVYGKTFLMLVLVLLVAWLADRLTRRLMIAAAARFARTTKSHLDDIMVSNGVFNNLAHFVPLIILYGSVPLVFLDFEGMADFIIMAMDIVFIWLTVILVKGLLRSGSDFLKTMESFSQKPIQSFTQVLVIITYAIGFILMFSEITGKSVISFLTALGAASAILLLVFRDTILGFVGSLQLATNDMVRIGDWITMEKYGADGDVIEISLNTVKVRNFDNTITTIPTYALISDSFKNWRGMQESGGRRIKRSVHLKVSSVRFLEEADVERYMKYGLVREYLENRMDQIRNFNEEHAVDKSVLLNGRNLTNIGVFRKYIEEYAANHPAINKELTLMSRQLPPTETGIPIEIYTFSSDKRWVNYEHILSDIFDHLLAAIPYFDLEVFELPTGSDLQTWGIDKKG